jgi:hypothetical protein
MPVAGGGSTGPVVSGPVVSPPVPWVGSPVELVASGEVVLVDPVLELEEDSFDAGILPRVPPSVSAPIGVSPPPQASTMIEPMAAEHRPRLDHPTITSMVSTGPRADKEPM